MQVKLTTLTEAMTVLQEKHGFNQPAFMDSLLKHGRIPLEVWWKLNTAGIIPLEAVLNSGSATLYTIVSSLPQLCAVSDASTAEDVAARKAVIDSFMTQLIRLAYGETAAEDDNRQVGLYLIAV